MTRRVPRFGVLLLASAVVGALTLGSCTTDEGWGGVHGDAATGARSGSTGDAPGEVPERHLGPQGRTAQFVISCGYSHTAADDPIVYPGRPGASHWHDFFGNTTADAHSTHESLLEGTTTCQNQLDTAVYWAPQLFVDGEAVTPSGSTAYYRVAPGVDPAVVQPYPADLRMIAGDMHATSPQSTDLVGWSCGVSTRHSSSPPACPSAAPLTAVITFPDCWNGKDLDSDDHHSHMTNSSGGQCPASHPVHVPQLTFAVAYPVSGEQDDIELASGPTFTLHADFVNAWHQHELEREVVNCLARGSICSVSSNRSTSPLFAS